MTTALVRFEDIDIPQPNKDCFIKMLNDLGWMKSSELQLTYIKEMRTELPRVQYKKMIKDDIRQATIYAVLSWDIKYTLALTEDRLYSSHAII